jgi:transcriptional regulator GlxA family with amidase domain
MIPKRIGILGFDNVTSLDLVGPADVFSTAREVERAAGRPTPYEIVIIGLTRRPFTCGSGIVYTPARSLADAPALDTLIVPGGAGLRVPGPNRAISAWIKARAPHIRRIATVCTGIYGVAPTGLLDGRRVTTHWAHADAVALRFPRLRVQPNAIFVKEGKFYTAAGVTAGIDLCLDIVKTDLGPASALAVARQLVVYLMRSGGQEQYSEPLRFQAHSSDRFSELASWMASHLGEDLSVESLAARASMCSRHFSRRFKHVFGSAPGSFVESLRLDEARRLLSSGAGSIAGIAESVGFASDDSFRRAFERRFGISPKVYRGRFGLRRAAS